MKIGTKISKLELLHINNDKNKNGKTVGVFLCECGNLKEIIVSSVKNNYTISCGCYRNSVSGGRTHNMTYSMEYRIWCAMKTRCSNKNGENYHLYGGKGVTVCDEWVNNFQAFIKDMGRAPSKKHSLDRINSCGNYEPSNCRWATSSEQARNTSRNRVLSAYGVTMIAIEWSEVLEVPYQRIINRVHGKPKWSDHEILFGRDSD